MRELIRYTKKKVHKKKNIALANKYNLYNLKQKAFKHILKFASYKAVKKIQT